MASEVTNLPEIHRKIDVPVQLAGAIKTPFFPVENARKMVSAFPDARLDGRLRRLARWIPIKKSPPQPPNCHSEHPPVDASDSFELKNNGDSPVDCISSPAGSLSWRNENETDGRTEFRASVWRDD